MHKEQWTRCLALTTARLSLQQQLTLSKSTPHVPCFTSSVVPPSPDVPRFQSTPAICSTPAVSAVVCLHKCWTVATPVSAATISTAANVSRAAAPACPCHAAHQRSCLHSPAAKPASHSAIQPAVHTATTPSASHVARSAGQTAAATSEAT